MKRPSPAICRLTRASMAICCGCHVEAEINAAGLARDHRGDERASIA